MTLADQYDNREATINGLYAAVGLQARLKELGYTARVNTDLCVGRIKATSHTVHHRELSAAIAVLCDPIENPWMEWSRTVGETQVAEVEFEIRSLGGLDKLAGLADGRILCLSCGQTTESGLSTSGKCQACVRADAARYED